MDKRKNKKPEDIEYTTEWSNERFKEFIFDVDKTIFLAKAQLKFLTRKLVETNNKKFEEAIKDTMSFVEAKIEWKRFLEEEHGKTNHG